MSDQFIARRNTLAVKLRLSGWSAAAVDLLLVTLPANRRGYKRMVTYERAAATQTRPGPLLPFVLQSLEHQLKS